MLQPWTVCTPSKHHPAPSHCLLAVCAQVVPKSTPRGPSFSFHWPKSFVSSGGFMPPSHLSCLPVLRNQLWEPSLLKGNGGYPEGSAGAWTAGSSCAAVPAHLSLARSLTDALTRSAGCTESSLCADSVPELLLSNSAPSRGALLMWGFRSTTHLLVCRVLWTGVPSDPPGALLGSPLVCQR